MTQDETLKFLIENGMLDLQNIEEQIEMQNNKKYLEMHTYKKWVNNEGKWCTYLPDATKPYRRALFRRNTEKEINKLIIDYWKQQEENPTIEEVFKEWNDRRLERKQIKPSTHLIQSQTFDRFYKDIRHKRISTMSENDWEDFLCDCITDYELTAKSFSGLKGTTKGFLKRAKKRKLIDMDVEHFFLELDVTDNDFKRRVINDEDEIFYDDEIVKIMNYIRQNPDAKNLGVALMFVTGIRIGELVALKHEDFNGTTFQVKRTESRHKDSELNRYVYHVDDFPKTPAGYRTVIVPTNQKWIVDKLRLLNPFGEYIFVDEKGNRITTVKIRKRLRLICNKVGIKPRSPHKIRKTYGSILLDQGLDRKLIEGQMGHTSIACTEEYYHRNRKRLDEKQAIIDSLPEFSAM